MTNPKHIILIGNKPVSRNYSHLTHEFDMIALTNRMMNWENTGRHTDILLADPHDKFLKLISGQDASKFREASHLLFNSEQRANISMLISRNVFTCRQIVHATRIKIKHEMKLIRDEFNITENIWPTNFFVMLRYLMRAYPCSKITIAGIDVYNRAQLFSENPEWSNGKHRDFGQIEQDFITSAIENNILSYLELE